MRPGTSAFLSFALVAILAFFVSPAFAQLPEGDCQFDSATASMIYSVTGGDATEYTMHIEASGCIALANPNDSVRYNDGPAFVDTVRLISHGVPQGTGTVDILYCEGDACFDACQLNIDCGLVVPTVSEWGLLVLLVLLLASGAYIIRRKRALASR